MFVIITKENIKVRHLVSSQQKLIVRTIFLTTKFLFRWLFVEYVLFYVVAMTVIEVRQSMVRTIQLSCIVEARGKQQWKICTYLHFPFAFICYLSRFFMKDVIFSSVFTDFANAKWDLLHHLLLLFPPSVKVRHFL